MLCGSSLEHYIDDDPRAGVLGVEQVILVVFVVDVNVVVVAPIRRPGIHQLKPIAAVLEARPAIDDLRALEAEVVFPSEVLVEITLRDASVISGAATLRLCRVASTVMRLAILVLLGLLLCVVASFLLGPLILLLGFLILLDLFLLILTGMLLFRLSALLILLLGAMLLVLGPLLVFLGLLGVVLSAPLVLLLRMLGGLGIFSLLRFGLLLFLGMFCFGMLFFGLFLASRFVRFWLLGKAA